MIGWRQVAGSILAALIPFLCKWLTLMPQRVYYILAGLFFVLALIALLYNVLKNRRLPSLKEGGTKFIIYCLIIAIAFIVCTWVFPVITVLESEQKKDFYALKEKYQDLRKKADGGSVDDMMRLASICYDKDEQWDETFLNYKEAEKYLEMAADSGCVEAHCYLARMKYYGLGRRASRSRAIEDLRKAYSLDASCPLLFETLYLVKVSPEEFPEGYNLCLSEVKRIRENERRAQIESQNKRKEYTIYEDCLQEAISSPLDTMRLAEFISVNLPLLKDAAPNNPQLYSILASMCLLSGDYESAYSYSSSYERFTGDKHLYHNLLFSLQQIYSEEMRQIDSILAKSDPVILDELAEKAGKLNLDPFFKSVIDYVRINNTKSDVSDEPYSRSEERDKLISRYLSDDRSESVSGPWPYLIVEAGFNPDNPELITLGFELRTPRK